MKRRTRSTHTPLLLIGLLLTVPFAALVLNAVHVKGMKSWPYPIIITSDNEFTADNGVSSGSGTKKDPYIIENLIIDYGIRIYSTTKYLIIRNCIIRRAPEGSISYFPVIEIGNARNIRFENCVITCGGWGVFLNTTKQISLINCTIHDLLFGGIWAYFNYWAYWDLGTEVLNKYLVINSCSIYNVKECAILLDAVYTGAVTNCTISNCGEGIRASFAVNVTISGNRITNVKEAAIWLDTTDTAWFDFNYTSGVVANNKICNCTYGLVVMLASNLTISGNVVDGCSYGFGICSIGDSAQLYHDIDSSNIVNGKPLLWLVDQQNVVIDGSKTPAAWIGIVGCSNIVIKNYEISNQFCGIIVADSTGWELRNVTVKHNILGVLCINSGGSMYNCKFVGNNYHYGLIADILKPVGGGYVDIYTWENMKNKGFWGACRLFNVSFDGRSGVSFTSDQFCAPDGSLVSFESVRVTTTEVVLYTTGGTVSYPIQGPPICLSAMDCRNPIVVEGMVARQMITGVLVDSCSNVTVKDSMIEGCLFGVMHLGTSSAISGLHFIDTTIERNHCVGVFLNTAGGKLDLTRCIVRENGVGACIWNGMQLSTWKDSMFINNTHILWWITGYALTTQLPAGVFAFAYSPGYDLYNCTFENLLFEGHMIDIFFEMLGIGLNRKNTFRGCVFKSSTGILAFLGSLGPNLIYNNAFMTGFGMTAWEAGPQPFSSVN
ncbi:right-handed parallel beta-helix repeat-containing protein, partial [archaeon]|nr:right-handed parallel beta-helix repeat-containing protein [archaeon]